jgi:hypothetical protein
VNLLIAAKSGWGKSYRAQATIERNLDTYDAVLVCDYKREYRGLVKAGIAKHWIVGPVEHREFGSAEWNDLLDNGTVVIERGDLTGEEWREAVAGAVRTARNRTDSVLVVIDEAHFLAPERETTPEPIEGLATTGRGEQKSAVWITQRLAKLDETVIAQADAYELGGFKSDADKNKLRGNVEYPVDVHQPGGVAVPSLPDGLATDDGDCISVRKWTDETGKPVGSEWVYSDDSGAQERRDTRGLSMESEHVGAEGIDIETVG